MEEFLNKKPENRKLAKEIQIQKYNLYEEERQKNIKKCIQRRQELVKDNKTRNKMGNKIFIGSKKNLNISNDNLNSEYKYKIKKYKKNYLSNDNGILFENNTYIMNHYEGFNASMKKDDLDKITCLNNEKFRIEKNKENSELFLKNVLKSEIKNENQIRKVKQKINRKEEKINEFLNDRKENIKFLENERYKDFKDREEKQKLYNKIMLNFGRKINMTDRKYSILNTEFKKSFAKNKNKNEELKEQISNYEKRNEDYKKRLSQIFDLTEIDKKKVTLPKAYENKPPDERQKKLLEIEDRYEMDIIKRENVFLNRLNIMQNKINDFIDKKEKKDSRIKQSIEKRDKMREEKKILHDIRMEEIKQKLLNTKIRLEKKRLKKLENIEQNNLKNYAIKQEKLKLYEERKKINQLTKEEKEAVKLKLQKIIKKQNNNDKIKDDEKFINKILYNN